MNKVVTNTVNDLYSACDICSSVYSKIKVSRFMLDGYMQNICNNCFFDSEKVRLLSANKYYTNREGLNK